MSEYGYDDRSRHRSSRSTRYREPEYVSETTYVERGGAGAPVRDLVYRPRNDSVEDIPRDFAPVGYRETKYREYNRPRSVRGYDDDYSDSGYGRRARSRGRDDGYYSDDYDRPRHRRRKSIGDQLKDTAEGFGLGGVIAAVTGKSRSRSRHRRDRYDDRHDDRHDDRRSRYSSRSRSRSRSNGRSRGKWEQAAKAAIVAGAVEAFRNRKTAGPWTGEKGQRIATAALGAAGIDSLVDKDPDHKSKRHVAESAIGGLVASRLANGARSRSQSRGRDASRSRSRSRARSIFGRSRSRGAGERGRERSTIRDVAGAGAVLAAGKAIYDRVRSKSRSRRDRSRSASSEDSYAPSRGRRYDKPRGHNDRSARSDQEGAGPGVVAKTSGKRDSSSSSASTTDMENQRKKMRGKELLTAGLATVATIHAAHGVYSSMVASEKRRKLVAEGEITAEEARKRKSKNMLQDAAAVGIAALGIKGAFSEWKEMNEHRHEVHELERKRQKRRKQREKREREQRQQQFMFPMANPYYSYPAPQQYPTTYADGNPYAAGSVPPPPIGVPRY